jgi:hypothetical protein
MIVPETKAASVVAAMKAAHPYEEVAHFVFARTRTPNTASVASERCQRAWGRQPPSRMSKTRSAFPKSDGRAA